MEEGAEEPESMDEEGLTAEAEDNDSEECQDDEA